MVLAALLWCGTGGRRPRFARGGLSAKFFTMARHQTNRAFAKISGDRGECSGAMDGWPRMNHALRLEQRRSEQKKRHPSAAAS